MTRVLIVADSPVVTTGLESLLRSSPGMEIAGVATTWRGLAALVAEHQPDVVLVDLPGQDEEIPPDVLRLASEGPGLGVVLLSPSADTVRLKELLRSGVRAVLPRTADAAAIAAAVEAVARGLVTLSPDDLEALLPGAAAGDLAASRPGLRTLSAREIEVLRMIAEGLGNKEIAWKLGISEHTVKFHVASIMTKLDASSRTEAVTIGLRLGYVLL